MSTFTFDDFVRTTLGGAHNVVDGKPLTPAQMNRVIAYLKSPGSGPDASTSFAKYLNDQLHAYPAKLPPGMNHVAFSGTDALGEQNFKNADRYIKDLGKKRAGLIGDTPWGKFVDKQGKLKGDPRFFEIERKFQVFMEKEGLKPFGTRNVYTSALQDIMWNAGSPEFFEDAIKRGRPIVAFVENAPKNRGFSTFELPTALKHPRAIINGYPVSVIAKASDPLAFVSKSAAEYMQLEKTLAQAATREASRRAGTPNSSLHRVSVKDIRTNLAPIEGYDAVNKTLFGRPLNHFNSLTLGQMIKERSGWESKRAAALRTQVPDTKNAKTTPATPDTKATPDPRKTSHTHTAQVPDTGKPTPGARALKGLGVAGVALAAYDMVDTGHKVIRLRSQSNETGADSAVTHFVGRSVGGVGGGILVGFLSGAGYGAVAGSPSGPGAMATTVIGGVVGGVAGAFVGEAWARQRDNERIFTQTVGGVVYHRDPDDPEGAWIKDGRVEATNPDLVRQLNFQMSKASYELGLANLPEPRKPFSIPSEQDRPGVRVGNWVCGEDGTWSRYLDSVRNKSWWEIQKATPEQAKALEAQSQIIIAENALNTPAVLAARYQIAYNGSGWDRNGSVPESIKKAAGTVGTLQASDGNTYTRGADGEWVHDGFFYDSTAKGNIRKELNAVYESQKVGLSDMAAKAKVAKEEYAKEQHAEKQMQQAKAEEMINQIKNNFLNWGKNQNNTQEQTPSPFSPSSTPAPPSQTKTWNGASSSIHEYRAQKMAQAEQNYDKHLNAFMEASPKVAEQLEAYVQETGESLRTASQHILFPDGKGDRKLLLDKPLEAIPLIQANKTLNESMQLANRNAPRPEAERNSAPGLG